MHLTPEELTTFNKLADTELGEFLRNYLKKLENYVYDVRNWGPGGTKENADVVAKMLKEGLYDKILPKSLRERKVEEGEQSEYDS